jgi:hypothetical protein
MASRSVSPSVTPFEEDLATHAGRHPSQTKQKTRVLTQHSLSLAQKATRSLRQVSDHAKAEELTTDLDILLFRHRTELETFAKDHNTKLEHVQGSPPYQVTTSKKEPLPSRTPCYMQNPWRSMEVCMKYMMASNIFYY